MDDDNICSINLTPDVMEEETLNAKSCIQALRKLITKAETEIDELEKDMMLLLVEQASTLRAQFLNDCCNALKDNVDCLEMALNGLRTSIGTVTEARLLLYKEPAKKLQLILDTLLHQHFK